MDLIGRTPINSLKPAKNQYQTVLHLKYGHPCYLRVDIYFSDQILKVNAEKKFMWVQESSAGLGLPAGGLGAYFYIFSSMASKPINIHWIKTGSQPY